mgnify:CR=1 FL=1
MPAYPHYSIKMLVQFAPNRIKVCKAPAYSSVKTLFRREGLSPPRLWRHDMSHRQGSRGAPPKQQSGRAYGTPERRTPMSCTGVRIQSKPDVYAFLLASRYSRIRVPAKVASSSISLPTIGFLLNKILYHKKAILSRVMGRYFWLK